MRVTGIITCHNYVDYVGGAIDSFLAQDYPHKNLLVIDDGSVDGSWEIICDKVGELPRFKALRVETPIGQSQCRNLCIQHAWEDTDVFAFLDADDEYLPGKISKSIELFKLNYGRVGLVYSDELVEDKIINRKFPRIYPSFSLQDMIDGKIYISSNFLVDKRALEQSQYFDINLRVSEAFDLLVRITAISTPLHIPEPLVLTRLTTRSLRKRISAEEWEIGNRKAIEAINEKK